MTRGVLAALGLLVCVTTVGCAESSDRSAVAAADTAADVAPEVSNAPMSLVLGKRVGADFVAWRQNSDLELVLGVQSGVHIEVAVALDTEALGLEEELLPVLLSLEAEVESQTAGAVTVQAYPLARHDSGRYVSEELVVVFELSHPSFYVGRKATVRASIELRSGQTATAELLMDLVNEE